MQGQSVCARAVGKLYPEEGRAVVSRAVVSRAVVSRAVVSRAVAVGVGQLFAQRGRFSSLPPPLPAAPRRFPLRSLSLRSPSLRSPSLPPLSLPPALPPSSPSVPSPPSLTVPPSPFPSSFHCSFALCSMTSLESSVPSFLSYLDAIPPVERSIVVHPFHNPPRVQANVMYDGAMRALSAPLLLGATRQTRPRVG